MSLLTDASLIVTPNGYNVGKLYSVVPNTDLGDMDVSRGTSATRVNSAGFIEIARTNLVLYSEEFDNAYWGKTNTTVTANATTAPDGTTTADKLTITTTSGTHQINRLSVVASSQCAMSIYAKADGVNTLTILDGGTANNGSIFNLSTVNVTNIGTGVGTIVSVGDGWYRCITIVTTTGFRLYCPNSSTSAGDGTSGIYIWGAQLEAGNVATEYIPTTTSIRTKFAGITQDGSVAQNIPRIDYPPLGGCPSILSEPVRTNLVLYSEEFDNTNWTKANATITANTTATTAPDGSFTADKFIPDTANSVHYIYTNTTLPSNAYTFSVFAKAGGETTFSMWLRSASVSARAEFNLSTGTIILKTATSATIEPYPNGWYRCSVYDSTPGTTAHIYGRGGAAFVPLNVTDGIFLWGAQVEVGTTPTSYIPTTIAAVLRNADVIRNISVTYPNTLIGQTEGTLFVDVIGTKDRIASAKYMLHISGSKSIAIIFYSTVIDIVSGLIDVYTSYTPDVNYKVAVCYSDTGNFRVYINGFKYFEQNDYVPGTFNAVSVGCTTGAIAQLNSNIKSAILWKTALTDDQCILLTGASFSTYPEMANNFPNTLIYTLQ